MNTPIKVRDSIRDSSYEPNHSYYSSSGESKSISASLIEKGVGINVLIDNFNMSSGYSSQHTIECFMYIRDDKGFFVVNVTSEMRGDISFQRKNQVCKSYLIDPIYVKVCIKRINDCLCIEELSIAQRMLRERKGMLSNPPLSIRKQIGEAVIIDDRPKDESLESESNKINEEPQFVTRIWDLKNNAD